MKPIGLCVVLCSGNAVQSLVEDISIAENAQLFVADQYNMIIASNMTDTIGSYLDTSSYRDELDDTAIYVLNGKENILQHVQAGQYTVSCLIPISSLMHDTSRVVRTGLLVVVAALFLLLLIGGSISIHISRSVAQMVQFMKRIEDGHENERMKLDSPAEIATIASSVNQMLDRLDETKCSMLRTQSELYEITLLNRQTQLSALQQQINPHFLFNTLSCIASMGAARGVPEIARIAAAMAKILRYCIKGADIVSVREEVDCIKCYLDIIHLRYHGKIQGNIEIEENIMGMRIPKMILQPIVENAVFHGLEPRDEEGLITVQGGFISEGRIQFVISDNGIGMDERTLLNLQMSLSQSSESKKQLHHNSIGLINIAERLRLQFGSQAYLIPEATLGKGAKITLVIPADNSAAE